MMGSFNSILRSVEQYDFPSSFLHKWSLFSLTIMSLVRLVFGLPRIPAVTMVLMQTATSLTLTLTRKGCASSLNKHEPLYWMTYWIKPHLLNVLMFSAYSLIFPVTSDCSYYVISFNISCGVSNLGRGDPAPPSRWKSTERFWRANRVLRHSSHSHFSSTRGINENRAVWEGTVQFSKTPLGKVFLFFTPRTSLQFPRDIKQTTSSRYKRALRRTSISFCVF